MEIIYVTFTIEVANEEYAYRAGKKGIAEVKIQITRDVLEQIDPGNLFVGALQAAMAKYDTPKEETE